MNKNTKIALVGVHGVGKSKICKEVYNKLYSQKNPSNIILTDKMDGDYTNLKIIPEQFREVVKDLNLPKSDTLKQTEEITLATYAKQLYLENLYQAQGKNILCDRSVLDNFNYYMYFLFKSGENEFFVDDLSHEMRNIYYSIVKGSIFSYDKIYLIEPSDREIENDGFRLTDKKHQLEIHQLFLEYFKDFSNVEIVNQEDAHKEEFIKKVANEFIL